jgi:hypothetical protein
MFNFEKISKELNKDKYFYHLKSEDFSGKIIYPLSTLKEKDNKVYKQSIKKYKGRENQLTTKIDLLNCEWQDCINLSTLNPAKIFEAAFLLGLKNNEYNIGKEILRFPISCLEGKKFCLYNDGKIDDSKSYSKVTVKSYKELEFVPSETMKYFAECKDNDEDPLIFSDVVHILLKDELDISEADVVKYEPSKIYY